MIHKDLNVIFDFLLRNASPSEENRTSFLPFAAMMTIEGKIAKLGNRAASGRISPAEALRSLEDGLRVMARQGRCRAVGLCPGSDIQSVSNIESRLALSIFLEHRDGSAYRFVIPWYTNRPAHRSSSQPAVVLFYSRSRKNVPLRLEADARQHKKILAREK
jgi:hypothetical protein